jgi:Tol biopolymer transport system component
MSDQSGTYDLWAAPVRNGQSSGLPALLRKDLGMVHVTGIAGDGSIYYASPSNRGDVYVGELDVDGATISNLQPLPSPRGVLSGHATWSPDGSRLLIQRTSYQVGRGPARSWSIIRNVATGEERDLVFPTNTTADGGYQARWSPDGKSLVFSYRPGPPSPLKVMVADVESGTVKTEVEVRNTRNFVAYLLPQVAADGQVYIAKGGANTKVSHVVHIDLQTGEEMEICAAGPSIWALSPDGSQIACAGYGDSIQILPVKGGPARDLVKGKHFGPMAWTGDGSHLIYTTSEPGAGPGGAGEYWMVPVSGGTPRRLNIPLRRTGPISIHSDNRRIAISSGGQTTEVWVLQNAIQPEK